MMKYVFMVCLGLFMGFAPAAHAAVGGVVRCTESGRLLKDVDVRICFSEDFVLTDAGGTFSLPGVSDGAGLVFDKPGFVVLEQVVKDGETLEIELKPKKLSAASQRMNRYIQNEKAYNTLSYREAPGWTLDFEESELTGDLASDPKFVRRDPSAVIKVGDIYYVYYTKGLRFSDGPVKKDAPWDQCDLWYATSKDGRHWEEQGMAVARGPAGRFDAQSVFTPEVLAHGGAYYLVYQAAPSPYNDRTFNVVGMAVAERPEGPWKKLDEPILRPTPNGMWMKEPATGRIPHKVGDFDSHKVHDPCLLHYKGKFYLYYKGQRVGENRYWGHREIMWGVAIADRPEGPYVKSEYNPVTNTGHEVCVWKYKGGIALIHTVDGPEAKTVQWSPDGINFELMSTVKNTPEALGLYRSDEHDKSPAEGVRWGLCHKYGDGPSRESWNYMQRFDVKNIEENEGAEGEE